MPNDKQSPLRIRVQDDQSVRTGYISEQLPDRSPRNTTQILNPRQKKERILVMDD